jgi:hypothetical protein
MALTRILGVALWLAFCGLSSWAENGAQPPGREAFTLKVAGQKTWGVRVGFGDPGLLAALGMEAGQLVLTQSLWAQVEGTVLDFLTIQASFNDQLGPGFQEFLVRVDRPPWYAELGRFVVGAEGEALGVYNKRVLGARLAVSREDLGLGAILARLEGISESLLVKGTTGFAERTFSYEDPDQPWRPAPYPLSVEGLFFLVLRLPFVEGFSKPALVLRTGTEFTQFLSEWGLEYLRDVAEKNARTALASGAYLVLRDEGDVLLFRQEPGVLLRHRVLELIDLYNAAQGLTGTQRKTYPFVEGSALEAAFLGALASLVEIQVDGEGYPLAQAQRHRYLSLEFPGVLPESLVVEVRLPGERDFRPLTDPVLFAFSLRLFPKEGVLRVDFPTEFFRPGAALRTSYAYTREGATLFLGLAVIPGSERVYLNGQRLARNADYSIDYEAGLLTLFVGLGPQDELRVDFERERGALGVGTEYERYFLGATLRLGQGQLGVWQAADLGAPSPSSRTMPNTHSLAAVSWQGKLGDWDYALRLGFSQNVFPPDDNARLPGRNKVNALVPVRTAEGEALVFAHQNGITVYRGGRFSAYGPAQGLTGRAALCLLPLRDWLLIGTDAGLTLVDLSLPGAFDRVRSWTRLYPEDWNKGRTEKFRGKRVLALAQDGELVYLATEAELILAPISSLTDPATWRKAPLPAGEPLALLWAQDLFLGTTAGLHRWTPTGWEELPVSGPVFALLLHNGDLLVAGADGVRVLRGGAGAGWVVYGVPVRAMAVWRDLVWYAAEDGVYREGERVLSGDFTALGVGLGGLWAGPAADPNFVMDLWRVDPAPQRFPQSQSGLDGRDFGRFTDPPAERTRLGPMASLSLARKLGAWDVSLRLHSRFPGYEEIGTSTRSDSHGMGFTARYAGDPGLSLALSGRADLAHLTSSPSLRLSGGLEGNWKGPVDLRFILAPTLGGAPHGFQLSSDFQVELKSTSNPSWTLGVSGKLTTPGFHVAGTLGGKLSYQPWPGLSLLLSWSRPYRTRGAPGQETLTLRAHLAGGTDHAWSLAWEETLAHPVDLWKWTSSRVLSGELRLRPFPFSGGRLAPVLSATFSRAPEEWRLSANVTGNVEFPGHRLSLRLNVAQEEHVPSERTGRSLGLNLSWSSSAWRGFQPSLSYSRDWRIRLHPRYAPQVSERESWEARASFDALGGKSELTMTWAPHEGIKVTNRFRLEPSFGLVTVLASLTMKDGKLSAKTEVEAALDLAPQWGLNVSGGVLFGAAPVRVAGYVGATLVANF